MIPQALLLTLLYSIAIRYFDRDLFSRIEALVLDLKDEDIPGDEKREIVRKAIKAEFVDLKNITIDSIIQIVLLKAYQKQ
jgi:hypothetical protein